MIILSPKNSNDYSLRCSCGCQVKLAETDQAESLSNAREILKEEAEAKRLPKFQNEYYYSNNCIAQSHPSVYEY